MRRTEALQGVRMAVFLNILNRCVRIPTKPAMHSKMTPATDSDLKPAGVPI